MLHALRRHPLPMRTRFGHSLVLTYALPPAVLEPLLPPGLALDTYTAPDGSVHGFVAVGVVSTLGLRPAPLPAGLGMDAVLTGYRIFTRFPTPAGKTMRGLFILRSDTHRVALATVGNLLTRYHYHLARVRLTVDGATLAVTVDSRDGGADLTVTADLASRPAPLPAGSPFARTCGSCDPGNPESTGTIGHPEGAAGTDEVGNTGTAYEAGTTDGVGAIRGIGTTGEAGSTAETGNNSYDAGSGAAGGGTHGADQALPGRLTGTLLQRSKLISGPVTGCSRCAQGGVSAARRFAGPLPYTFDHEQATGSIVVVKAHRSTWLPEPVTVRVSRCTFFDRGPFAGSDPVLAQAFHVADLDYGWHRGVRRAQDGSAR